MAAHLYYQGGMYGTLGSAVTQQLVAAARTACDTLERAGAGPACESLPLLQVDSMYCGTDHPGEGPWLCGLCVRLWDTHAWG